MAGFCNKAQLLLVLDSNFWTRLTLIHPSTSWFASPCNGPANAPIPAAYDMYASDKVEPTRCVA